VTSLMTRIASTITLCSCVASVGSRDHFGRSYNSWFASVLWMSSEL